MWPFCRDRDPLLLNELRHINHKMTVIDRRLKELEMAVSVEVQARLDQSREFKTLAESVDAGFDAQTLLIQQLKDQIANMPVGQPLSQEDKDALTEIGQNMEDAATVLRTDVFENTPETPPSQG